MENSTKIFKTNKRIRLGIWGLGRGKSFHGACKALNMDVVAGCDQNDLMLDRFKKDAPDVMAFKDAKEFLEADIDAVCVATLPVSRCIVSDRVNPSTTSCEGRP